MNLTHFLDKRIITDIIFNTNLVDILNQPDTLIITDTNINTSYHLSKVHHNILILPSPLMPNSHNIDLIIEHAQHRGIKTIIGFGSGTICDLCKCVTYQLRLHFTMIATALSMNGYLSQTASIIKNHGKASIQAKAPDVLIFNTDILQLQPEKLIKAGFCDLMARQTAQIDWLLDNLINYDQSYNPLIFDEIINTERLLVQQLIIKKDFFNPQTQDLIIKSIILSSLGMWYAGTSRPASGSEHAIAHILEPSMPHLLHGELIAITTIFTIDLLLQNTHLYARYSHQINEVLTFPKLHEVYNTLDIQYRQISETKLLEAAKNAATYRKRFGILNLYFKA